MPGNKNSITLGHCGLGGRGGLKTSLRCIFKDANDIDNNATLNNENCLLTIMSKSHIKY